MYNCIFGTVGNVITLSVNTTWVRLTLKLTLTLTNVSSLYSKGLIVTWRISSSGGSRVYFHLHNSSELLLVICLTSVQHCTWWLLPEGCHYSRVSERNTAASSWLQYEQLRSNTRKMASSSEQTHTQMAVTSTVVILYIFHSLCRDCGLLTRLQQQGQGF